MEKKVDQMIQDLQTIRHTYDLYYAPIEWKGLYFNYSLDQAFEEAKKEVLSNPRLSVREFHQIVKRFLGSLNDYHVKVVFESTESSELPLNVELAQGRCFIRWIDQSYFSKGSFLPSIGDEIITFDGRPIMEVIDGLVDGEGIHSNLATDRSIAATKLTLRRGDLADDTPFGEVSLLIKSAKKKKSENFNVHWSYKPETILHPHDFIESWFQFIKEPMPSLENFLSKGKVLMINPLYAIQKPKMASKPSSMNSKKGFLPPLGKIIWEEDYSREGESEEDLFTVYSYIYELPLNSEKWIGYLRIPSFRGESEDLIQLAQIMQVVEKNSDALVIDLTNNHGGDAEFMFQFLSLLADSSMELNKDLFKLNYTLVRDYREMKKQVLELIDDYDDARDSQDNDSSNQEALDKLKKYCEFFDDILNVWNEGRVTTNPIHLLGMDVIAPNRIVSYTKPIVVLVNEMDFSCADYFPATLQDNRRAQIFGTRTAGAGGAVSWMTFSGISSGIRGASYTYTLSQRQNGATLENLGVEPDIKYEVTAEDIQNEYKGYRRALNQAVQNLVR